MELHSEAKAALRSAIRKAEFFGCLFNIFALLVLLAFPILHWVTWAQFFFVLLASWFNGVSFAIWKFQSELNKVLKESLHG